MCVSLVPMTKALCRQYYQGFASDPDIYMDMSLFQPYVYSDSRADACFDRQLSKRRIFLAVMYEGAPCGEVVLKDLDDNAMACTLSIHLQNDSVKGRGIGTRAERLALRYAFSELGRNTVYADAVLKNVRSQHVLEKAGFRFLREEGDFRYYRCDRDSFEYELAKTAPPV